MQVKALVILNFLDDLKEHEGNIRAIKRAYLSSGLGDPASLFPDEFSKGEEDKTSEEATQQEKTGEHVIYDYSDVTWKSGTEAYEEYRQLMAQVDAAKSGTLQGDLISNIPQWTDWR